MVAALATAFAPAAETAVALPKVVEVASAIAAPAAIAPPAPIGESPELLALGAEVEAKLDAYRSAAARLAEARATAVAMWPAVPDEIVLTTRRQRGFFGGCFDLEQDLDGKTVWPETIITPEGRQCLARSPNQILQADPLRALAAEMLADEESDAEMNADLAALIDIAEAYEAECEAARAVLARAVEPCGRAARALCDLAWKIREHAPSSIAGVMVHARVLAAYSEAERHSGGHAGQGHAGVILGRGLAEAVLRLAA